MSVESTNIVEEQPTSSSSTNESSVKATPESLKLGINFLVQGKRHLVVKDFQQAIESLGEACRLLSDVDPQGSKPTCFESAEAHFFYGKALLEQSRLELGVLETPDIAKEEEGSEEDSDEEEEEKEKSDDDEEESENEEMDTEVSNGVSSASNDAESSEAVANGTVEDKKASDAKTPQESAITSTEEAEKTDKDQEVDLNAPSPSINPVQSGQVVVDNEVPSTSTGLTADAQAALEKAAEEELSNLELAWEVLEVAKIGYRGLLKDISETKASSEKETKTEEEVKKRSSYEKLLKKRLADTHCSLGEVATESENYNQAIDEFKTGLEILNEIEGSDSREIAQYHFQMGLAFSFDKKFPEAIDSFKKSVEIIETRIAILKEKIAKKQTAKDLGIELEDPSKTEADEVQELTALLPELQEKITDTIDAERESQALEEEEEKEKEIMLRNSPIKNPNPPAANDISHLVKKKKKAEDAAQDEPPVKKMCIESEKPVLQAAASTEKTVEITDGVSASVPASTATNGHPIAIDA